MLSVKGKFLNIPEKLFKYESFSIQSLLNLKNQTIYFSSPSGFNDPYDCALKAELNDPTTEELQALKKLYLSKKWPAHVIEGLKAKPLEKLKPILVRAARDAHEKVIETFIEHRGVSCFSEVNDELLMWAHYADKYQGFCLEFSTDTELFEKAKKVKYVDKMPSLNMFSIYENGQRQQILELFCTKSKAWKYEKEWRVIHHDADTKFTYPYDALTGVYFGPNMRDDVMEIICLVLQGQNPSVKFWKGNRSEATFRVEFQEVTYISDFDAQKLRVRT